MMHSTASTKPRFYALVVFAVSAFRKPPILHRICLWVDLQKIAHYKSFFRPRQLGQLHASAGSATSSRAPIHTSAPPGLELPCSIAHFSHLLHHFPCQKKSLVSPPARSVCKGFVQAAASRTTFRRQRPVLFHFALHSTVTVTQNTTLVNIAVHHCRRRRRRRQKDLCFCFTIIFAVAFAKQMC